MAKKRAILSVYDKTGITEFAKRLVALGFELVSTGGTYQVLTEAGLEVTYISEVTGFPEILDGRVKTLHPMVHGGILAKREVPAHMTELEREGIVPIDLVAVNLYPFQATIAKPGVTMAEALENIDIGGPTMIRAAAKNFPSVIVVVNPAKYEMVCEQMANGGLDYEARLALAREAFLHTARYDAAIQDFLASKLGGQEFPEELLISYHKVMDLRYGENPHQKAAYYQETGAQRPGLAAAKQLNGKELSFNNINDANAALQAVVEFTEPAAVCVKHTTPCGVAIGKDIYEAYCRAYEADPVSIFGGIVALNREVDKRTAEKMQEIFLEVIIAPKFSQEALAILSSKKNLRLLELDLSGYKDHYDFKKVVGGLLVQEADHLLLSPEQAYQVVTERMPSEAELADLLFGWKVVKHVKSNAIVVAKNGRTLGIGGGQVNRIDPTRYALKMAGEQAKGAVLASDAFFPMPDVVQACAEAGISAIIQPGGSIRDADSIAEANKAGIAMIFTGVRHFKH
ncbi:MAG: bifunctional phosphoribosylaminoimidazolecarboxamide formyltransferase/IMP cyclohydrolase [Firmicutes bacterium]|nr:bifunctional phosphoribosylaminoimidazolecarboxamide formyltransferase/IMP cyclohydrolase [Bacillota bacterium]